MMRAIGKSQSTCLLDPGQALSLLFPKLISSCQETPYQATAKYSALCLLNHNTDLILDILLWSKWTYARVIFDHNTQCVSVQDLSDKECSLHSCGSSPHLSPSQPNKVVLAKASCSNGRQASSSLKQWVIFKKSLILSLDLGRHVSKTQTQPTPIPSPSSNFHFLHYAATTADEREMPRCLSVYTRHWGKALGSSFNTFHSFEAKLSRCPLQLSALHMVQKENYVRKQASKSAVQVCQQRGKNNKS